MLQCVITIFLLTPKCSFVACGKLETTLASTYNATLDKRRFTYNLIFTINHPINHLLSRRRYPGPSHLCSQARRVHARATAKAATLTAAKAVQDADTVSHPGNQDVLNIKLQPAAQTGHVSAE